MLPPKLNASVAVATLIAILLGTLLSGCNADPRARREMALLRAEILDLEDQFYSMKSRYRTANDQLMACQGQPIDSYGDAGFVESTYVENETPIYDDYVTEEFIDDGFVYSENEVYESPQFSGRYHPHAVPDLRGSAGRLFGQSTSQIRRPFAQPQQQAPARRGLGLGLFNGRGLGLFRRNNRTSNYGDYNGFSDSVNYAPQFVQNSLPAARQRITKPNDSSSSDVAASQFEPDPLNVNIDYGDDYAYEKDDSYGEDVIMDDDNSDPDIVFESDLDSHEPTMVSSSRLPVDSETVSNIAIVSSITGGKDVDGEPGDDEVVVVIQPKNEYDQVLSKPGEVTVSLIEPSANGDEQRIGLWKFTSEEFKLFDSKMGFVLRLPWDKNIPKSDQLLVYVRYWTADGRRLETSSRLNINPPSSEQARDSDDLEGWTKRDSNWDLGSPEQSLPSSLVKDPKIPNLDSLGNDSGNRNRVKATPASSTITKPAWRPSR